MATGATGQNIFFPFLPTSIAGCQLWLDGADSTSTANVTSGTWLDKSGLSHTATSNAGGSAFSMGTINGLSAVTFPSGSATAFIAPAPVTLSSSVGFSVFFVAKWTAASSDRARFFITQAGSSIGCGLVADPANTIPTTGLLYCGTSGGDRSVGGITLPSNTPFVYSAVFTSTATNGYSHWLNGTTGGTQTPYGAGSANGMVIGNYAVPSAVYAFIGQMGEFIVYSTALSTNQRQQVEAYLAWKWGTQGVLDATNPYKNAVPQALPTINSSQVGTIPLSIVRNKVTNPMQGFTPASTGGLTQWLDGADPLGTGTPPALGTLATWYDKSGNGRNASAASAASYTTGGILFTSGNYYTMNVPYSANYSIFLVATNTTNIQCYFFGRHSIGGGRDPTFIQGFLGGGILLEWYEASDRATIATTPLSPFIASVDHIQGTSIVGWYYGTQSFSNAQTRTYVANAWDRLGDAGLGANYYAGTMKELIFVGSNVTTPQRQQLEGYLAWKWGLQANLPPGHPYGGNSPFPSTTPLKTISTSSIFKPTNYAGCELWLDAFDPFGNGSRQKSPLTLTRWVDKSSSARHANMFNGSSIAYSPTAFNNKPAFLFTQTQNMSSAAAAGTFSSAFTFFIIYQRTGGVTYDTLVTRTVSNLAAPVDFYTNISTGNFSRNIGNGTAQSAYNTTSGSNFTNVTTPSLYYANATPANGLLDAFNFATPTNPSSGVLTGVYYADNGTAIYIGTRADSVTTLTASVSEVIVYSTTPTDQQRQTIEGYLAWKWGLVASLPAGHPYKNYPPPPQ